MSQNSEVCKQAGAVQFSACMSHAQNCFVE